VDRVSDQLLSGSGFAADEDRGVGLGDLRDLFVHLAYGPAGPDDVREVVPLPQLLTEVGVLGQQPAALVLHRPLNLQRLRDHRGDDPHEFHAAVEIAFGLEAQIDAEGADGLAVQEDRHAHEAELLASELAPCGAMQEIRLTAHTGHDHRLAAFDNPAGNAFAQPVADALGRLVETVGRFDRQLAVLAEQRHHAPDRAVALAENLEDAVERRFQIQRAGQRLAHFEERRQPASFTGIVSVGALRFHIC
jgi:hypothetical protein